LTLDFKKIRLSPYCEGGARRLMLIEQILLKGVKNMSLADNKDIARRLLEGAFNRNNLGLIDELVAADFIDHAPLPGLPPNREGFKQSFAIFRGVFPDMIYKIEDVIAEGDKVVIRWSAGGTQKGELMGIPPTGRKVAVTGTDIFRVANGKLAEMWLSWDMFGMMQQLGAIPAR
jgi:steroid delta-isomerase-like uncharacterized protein